MERTERECVEALRAAAAELGESPTKAQYEELGSTPASATILRVMGRWNAAKEAAGLETNVSTGRRVGAKPEGLDVTDAEWANMSVDQRWHYRNVDRNTARTKKRRAALRAWVYRYKRDSDGCSRCDEDDPACLDFHHTDEDEKNMAITKMVTYGYGREKIATEIAKCVVLCSNCHRKEHYVVPDDADPPSQHS